MRRYMIYISYIGTFYRGLARQAGVERDLTSVQGLLQDGMNKRFPRNPTTLHSSSRTDKGVHAFVNTMHFDWDVNPTTSDDIESTVTNHLNNYLHSSNHDIRVLRTREVPMDFNARRNAKQRIYLYRLGVFNSNIDISKRGLAALTITTLIPLMEKNRCHFVGQPFCMEKFTAAAERLNGLHDFKTFSCKTDEEKITVKSMDIQVSKGSALLPDHDPLYANIDFYDILVTSRSFLYKQIRKMVGAMIGVAKERITLADIDFMLQNPSIYNWNDKCPIVSPDGLYLKDVQYDEEELENWSTTLNKSEEAAHDQK